MNKVEQNKRMINHNDTIATVNRGYVSLPYTQEDFNKFISSLLGRGQEIERIIRGNFEINKNFLISTHQLIDQRIQQQNKGNLLNFSAKVFYSDESTVSLYSIEELQTYNEFRNVICEAVHLSWDYLIKFEDKEFPEKQQINILIVAGEKKPFRLIDTPYNGKIRISINHTARTWAVDLESLLVQNFESVMDKNEGIKEFIYRKSEVLTFLISLCFFIGIIYISTITTNNFSSNAVANVNNGLLGSELTTDERINFISNYIAAGEWSKFSQKLITFILIGFFMSVSFAVSLYNIFDNLIVGHSFIIINDATEKYRIKTLEKANKDYFKIIGTIIIGIISGIIANYIFQYIAL